MKPTKFSKSENIVLHNAKIKHYKNGVKNIVCCNQPIFKEDTWEYIENKTTKRSKSSNTSDRERTDSIKRAKDRIFDIVYCNDWSYFVTLTFDTKKIDSHNNELCKQKILNWLRWLVQSRNFNYILVPELHQVSGGIHFHLLCNGDLDLVDSGTYLCSRFDRPVKFETLQKHNINLEYCQKVYNVTNWKYGFSTAIKCYGQPQILAFYVTKYVTKDIQKIFGKYYYCGGNLQKRPLTTYEDLDFYELNAQCSIDMPNSKKKLKYLITDSVTEYE